MNNLKNDIFLRVLIIILMFPGFFWASVLSPYDMLRFAPIGFLVICFPFSSLAINYKIIIFSTLVIISFLIYFQILCITGSENILFIRDKLYPIEINLWSSAPQYGVTSSLLYGFREFRAAGIFYNPNLHALMISLFFFIFMETFRFFHTFSSTNFPAFGGALVVTVSLAVLYSLYLTGSRTGILVFLIYFGLFALGRIYRLNSRHFQILVLIILCSFVLGMGFNFHNISMYLLSENGSLGIKFKILFDYLSMASIFNIFWGGEFFILFDAEYSYWIGASGVSGLIGLVLFYLFYFKKVVALRSVIVCLLLTSATNSVFYGLQTGVLVTFLFVILTSIQYQNPPNVRERLQHMERMS